MKRVLQKVKFKQDPGGAVSAHVFVDDKEIHRASHFKFEAVPQEIPIATIEVMANFEYEGKALVRINENPDTLQEVTKILRNELLSNEELYNGYIASIQSALEDMLPFTEPEDQARHILNRIIGKE